MSIGDVRKDDAKGGGGGTVGRIRAHSTNPPHRPNEDFTLFKRSPCAVVVHTRSLSGLLGSGSRTVLRGTPETRAVGTNVEASKTRIRGGGGVPADGKAYRCRIAIR